MHKPDSGPGAYRVRNYWHEAIDEPRAGQMQYLKRLILSRPHLERVPEQDLIAGKNGVRENIVTTSGRPYLLAYRYTAVASKFSWGLFPNNRHMRGGTILVTVLPGRWRFPQQGHSRIDTTRFADAGK
jgi:hypothetical protein